MGEKTAQEADADRDGSAFPQDREKIETLPPSVGAGEGHGPGLPVHGGLGCLDAASRTHSPCQGGSEPKVDRRRHGAGFTQEAVLTGGLCQDQQDLK